MTPIEQTKADLKDAETIQPAGSTVAHSNLAMAISVNRLAAAVEHMMAGRDILPAPSVVCEDNKPIKRGGAKEMTTGVEYPENIDPEYYM